MTPQTKPKYWQSPVPTHDDFGARIEAEFVDGKTRMGPWALMNPASYRLYGIGLGVGKGQHYIKMPNGRWLKITD